MRRWSAVAICMSFSVFLAGCPKGNPDYKSGMHAEDLQDYDAAVQYYLKAVKVDPHNANYQIKLNQARFEAGQLHVHQGLKLREKAICRVRWRNFRERKSWTHPVRWRIRK